MPNPRTAAHLSDPERRASSVPGSATTAGTARYAARFKSGFSSDFYRSIGTSLSVSSIGMGTYLGECDDAEDERYAAAITEGLRHGLNVIDTAINYRCQRSERAVGRALRKALDDGVVVRDEVVICTKGGFIPLDGRPPSSREAYDRFLREHYFDAGVMSPSEVVAGGHCLTPQFLNDQIERSLTNLGIDRIDVYYLHNPEHQATSLDGKDFRTALSDAFQALEEHVRLGRIGVYGCATWDGFRVAPTKRGHLSLEDIIAVAKETRGNSHHFRVIQLPLNLAMNEAVRSPTQKLGSTAVPLLQAASELGVTVIGSASLMQAQLTKGLPSELDSAFPGLRTDAQRALAFARSLPVASALVGMRSVAHIRENLGAGAAASAA
jgi:aryl-alcohol dehydrogenase-like predicted oxidoreductase